MVAELASLMVTESAKKPPEADKKINKSTKAGKPSDNRGTTHPPNDLLLSENSESISADGFVISVGGSSVKKGKGNSMDTNP